MTGEQSTMIGIRTHGPDLGMPQKRKVRHDGWTEKRRAIFLEHLSETANVTASAAAAGMSAFAAHHLRRREPAFQALWHEALEDGYRVLEEQLLAGALSGTTMSRPENRTELALLAQSQSTALNLLKLHYRRVTDIRARREEARDPDVILAEITGRLEQIRSRRGPA